MLPPSYLYFLHLSLEKLSEHKREWTVDDEFLPASLQEVVAAIVDIELNLLQIDSNEAVELDKQLIARKVTTVLSYLRTLSREP